MKSITPGDEVVIDSAIPQNPHEEIKRKFGQGAVFIDPEEAQKRAKLTLRDRIWNYPAAIVNAFNVARPFSFIIFYTIICLLIFHRIANVDFVAGVSDDEKDVFVEGTIGNVINPNPIFVTKNAVDEDIHELVFQKLIEIDENAKPIPEIASHWEVNQGTEYLFHLRRDIKFSTGEQLTAQDVLYTFETGKYLATKRGKDTIAQGLIDVKIEKIDDFTVKFTLSEANAAFFEMISVPIVSSQYFEGVSPDRLEYSVINQKPVGSGPYRIDALRDTFIVFEASEYYPEALRFSTIVYRMYPDYDALKIAYQNNLLDGVSNIGNKASEFQEIAITMNSNSLLLRNRKKVIYLNTREERKRLTDPLIRQALGYLIDRKEMIAMLDISGRPAKGPISEDSWAFNKDMEFYEYDEEAAETVLYQAGYSKNDESGYFQDDKGKILSYTLTYLDNEFNSRLAEEIMRQYGREGVLIELDPEDYDTIINQIIATRDFDMLLYEIETSIDPDQYNLWHSLKVDYPDLNLSGATEKAVRIDTMLESGRTTYDLQERKESYYDFQKFFMSDAPVIFLYEPDGVYFYDNSYEFPEFSEDMNSISERFELIVKESNDL
ncbi:hypothetical protein GF357_00695 [Candidatus Dojkabacteria bacterium]|nr:hypothetical protein [Candidatus Dojkabacteria bacterium]